MRRSGFGRAPTLATYVALALLVGVSSFGSGLVLASLTVKSTTETGTGAANDGQPLTWWTPGTVAVDTIPSSVPTGASTTMGSPTILPTSNVSYTVGSAAANHSAVRWDIVVKSAPVAIELEVSVSVVNLSSSVLHAFSIFVESPPTGITGPITVSLYLDMGSGAGAFRTASVLTQQCSSFGSCP